MENYAAEQVTLLEFLAPQILEELDTIDYHMQRLKDLIRPHTSVNKTPGSIPLFSETFERYRECLMYSRTKLC